MKLLRTTYCINDDITRVMIGMRLKDKALEWLYSRPKCIEMPIDELFNEMRNMYQPHRSKLMLRRTFENRTWKKDETFSEYLHDKMIMGNRVPIDKKEMLDYIIDDIPDEILQNQARIQRFETMSDLQEAFEKVTLGDKNTSRVGKTEKRSGGRIDNDSSKKGTTSKETRDKWCFICGERDH